MKIAFKHNHLSIAILALSFFVLSCDRNDSKNAISTKDFSPSASFIVNNANETMPVWVNGNASSDYIILAVHGGPGSNALDFLNYQGGTAFKKIQEKYLVAYWQQRASGQSIGPDDKKYYTIAQYADDTDKVVDELRKTYPGKKIVLMGHSWGGMLTSSYLKDAARRAKITGWIFAAGLQNGTTTLQTSKADLIAEADARIAISQELDEWKLVKEKLAESSSDSYVNQFAYAVTEIIPEVTIKVKNADFQFTQRAMSSNTNLFSEIMATNNNSSLSNVTMPCLVLWGKYDFAVSKTYRKEFLENIGSQKVTSIDFNASGHYMMFHEPDLFAKSVIDFIGTL